ncbi:MAG: SIMPL domain-containing protein [Nitrososphaerota archaeon]
MQTDTRGVAFYVVLGLLAAVAVTAIVTNVLAITGGKEVPVQPKEEEIITVIGSARTYVMPDVFTATLGVETMAKTVADAATENARVMNEIISALKVIGLTDKEISTSMYTIYPVYDEFGKDIIGFRVVNMLTVTTDKLNMAGKIVDESVKAGANRIYGLNFYLSEQKAKQLRLELMESALEDAKAKADALLGPLGLRIIRVKTASIIEGYEPIPVYKAEYMGVETPIVPGVTSVSVSVQVTYVIG